MECGTHGCGLDVFSAAHRSGGGGSFLHAAAAGQVFTTAAGLRVRMFHHTSPRFNRQNTNTLCSPLASVFADSQFLGRGDPRKEKRRRWRWPQALGIVGERRAPEGGQYFDTTSHTSALLRHPSLTNHSSCSATPPGGQAETSAAEAFPSCPALVRV